MICIAGICLFPLSLVELYIFSLGVSAWSHRRFAMSLSVTSENVFLTALQPNSTVSTYAVPSENELAHGGSYHKEEARFKRVHQQVSMRLAEKSTLPRQNGSSSQHAASGVSPCALISLYYSYNNTTAFELLICSSSDFT